MTRISAQGDCAAPCPSSASLKTPRDQLIRLRVEADICPQVLLRVLGLISQQALVPLTIACSRETDSLSLDVEVDGLSEQAAAVLVAKVESIVTVRSARLRAPDCRRRRSPEARPG